MPPYRRWTHSSYWSIKWYAGGAALQAGFGLGSRLYSAASGLVIALVIQIAAVTAMV